MKTMIPNVAVPEGSSGIWRVERFTIEDKEARMANIMASFKPGGSSRSVKPGSYTRLMRGNVVVMSDTDAEKRDHSYAVYKASGHILINGLGIGMVLNACLLKPEVTKVTVIENSQDVIALCGGHYQSLYGDRVEIIHANALEYSPKKGIKFGAVWHDIWDYICADNLPEMHSLHRKYGRRTEWQGSWARELCEINR